MGERCCSGAKTRELPRPKNPSEKNPGHATTPPRQSATNPQTTTVPRGAPTLRAVVKTVVSGRAVDSQYEAFVTPGTRAARAAHLANCRVHSETGPAAAADLRRHEDGSGVVEVPHCSSGRASATGDRWPPPPEADSPVAAGSRRPTDCRAAGDSIAADGSHAMVDSTAAGGLASTCSRALCAEVVVASSSAALELAPKTSPDSNAPVRTAVGRARQPNAASQMGPAASVTSRGPKPSAVRRHPH